MFIYFLVVLIVCSPALALGFAIYAEYDMYKFSLEAEKEAKEKQAILAMEEQEMSRADSFLAYQRKSIIR